MRSHICNPGWKTDGLQDINKIGKIIYRGIQQKGRPNQWVKMADRM